MKQAWNELFNYQANNPLSFQFSVFKSSDIHPRRGRQLEIRKSKQQESALSLREIMEWFLSFPDDIKNSENVPPSLLRFHEVICWFCFYYWTRCTRGLEQPSIYLNCWALSWHSGGRSHVCLCSVPWRWGGWRHPRGCFLTSTTVAWSISKLPALPRGQLGTW